MKRHDDIEITVILNVFKRAEHLEAQLNAIENQTIKPKKIFVWQNGNYSVIPENLKSRFTLIECSENLGVWARFAFALNARTDYICLFDDDTIPGERWFENCINTLKTHDGLLGTKGLRFMRDKSYKSAEHFGWSHPNEETMKVDIVGHSWFFKRELLAHYWSELPPKDFPITAGEDIHFSYMIQKFGINTYVPPHPKNDMSLWGSLPESGYDIGADENGISKQSGANDTFTKVYNYYREKGFEIIYNNVSKRLFAYGKKKMKKIVKI
ncbi:MAG: glycosyltransferase [Campylobacterales bacterium]|nr:glycosyltransferase [Campylobacterales bacterium]